MNTIYAKIYPCLLDLTRGELWLSSTKCMRRPSTRLLVLQWHLIESLLDGTRLTNIRRIHWMDYMNWFVLVNLESWRALNMSTEFPIPRQVSMPNTTILPWSPSVSWSKGRKVRFMYHWKVTMRLTSTFLGSSMSVMTIRSMSILLGQPRHGSWDDRPTMPLSSTYIWTNKPWWSKELTNWQMAWTMWEYGNHPFGIFYSE